MGVIQQSVNQMLGTAALASAGIEKATGNNLDRTIDYAKTAIDVSPTTEKNKSLKLEGKLAIRRAEEAAAQNNIISNISARRNAKTAVGFGKMALDDWADSGVTKEEYLNQLSLDRGAASLQQQASQKAMNNSKETISGAVETHNNMVDFFSKLKGADTQTFYKFGKKGGDK